MFVTGLRNLFRPPASETGELPSFRPSREDLKGQRLLRSGYRVVMEGTSNRSWDRERLYEFLRHGEALVQETNKASLTQDDWAVINEMHRLFVSTPGRSISEALGEIEELLLEGGWPRYDGTWEMPPGWQDGTSSFESSRGQDHYEVLGVPMDASQKDLKLSYSRLVRNLHSDLNPGVDHHDHLTRVNEAYGVLRDPVKRAVYNAS